MIYSTRGYRSLVFWAGPLLAAALLCACGQDDTMEPSGTTGSASMQLVWPEPARSSARAAPRTVGDAPTGV